MKRLIFGLVFDTPYLKLSNMKKPISTFKLVEGTYSPSDSAEVLLSLIADKIKFHNLQLLSLRDKESVQLEHAKRRIEELKASRKMITDVILRARDTNYQLKIDGVIKIELL